VDWLLRAVTPQDRGFLFTLHRTTMRDVIEATWGWDDEWQEMDFTRRLVSCEVHIIEIGGYPAGGLWLEWKSDMLYLRELQLSPEFQGRGFGTAILRQVIDQATQRGLPTVLSVVEANRRAKQLYERIGFEVVASEPPFIRMKHLARISRE